MVLEEQVPVFVGALGTPAAFASRLHDAGIVVMSVVGSTKQAVQVARDGADVVIAQGTEGGGHTGHVGTMALVPQVLDAVDVPVVATGGIGDGRDLAAALVMGCQGVWVGTRFLATVEAGLADWPRYRARVTRRDAIAYGHGSTSCTSPKPVPPQPNALSNSLGRGGRGLSTSRVAQQADEPEALRPALLEPPSSPYAATDGRWARAADAWLTTRT